MIDQQNRVAPHNALGSGKTTRQATPQYYIRPLGPGAIAGKIDSGRYGHGLLCNLAILFDRPDPKDAARGRMRTGKQYQQIGTIPNCEQFLGHD